MKNAWIKPINFMPKPTEIFFLDVQEAFYFGPFYYDLSRFIDTTKVFSIIKNPLCVLGGYNRVRRAV